MAHPMGEANLEPLEVDLDRRPNAWKTLRISERTASWLKPELALLSHVNNERYCGVR